ncbi:MAG: hypothetical protein IBX56_16465, partial [Methylomicrobium sp.]|nr:hypothetical protein [Methylomicrobium sp.]
SIHAPARGATSTAPQTDDTPRKRKRKTKEEPVKEATKEEATKEEPVKEATKEEAAKEETAKEEATAESIRKECMRLVRLDSSMRPAIVELLAKFGAETVKDLKQEDYKTVMDELLELEQAADFI